MPVPQIVTVCFDSAERDPAQAVNLEHVLCSGSRGDDEDIGFFANPNLVADAVDRGFLEVGMQG